MWFTETSWYDTMASHTLSGSRWTRRSVWPAPLFGEHINVEETAANCPGIHTLEVTLKVFTRVATWSQGH